MLALSEDPQGLEGCACTGSRVHGRDETLGVNTFDCFGSIPHLPAMISVTLTGQFY